MVASGASLFANFAGYGLYKYISPTSTWTRINSVVPDSMVASGTTAYANFAGYGLYKYDGTGWTQINPVAPDSMFARP